VNETLTMTESKPPPGAPPGPLAGDDAPRLGIEDALRGTEAEYRPLFENNPHPMWVYDVETLRFLAVNKSAVAHYGYSEREFLSMTIAELRPPEDIPALQHSIARVKHGSKDFGVWRHFKKDGTLIDVEISSDSIPFQGRAARLVLASDITLRLHGERELAKLNRALRMLSACNESLIRATDEQRLLEEVCLVAVGIGGYKVAWVGYANDDAEKSITAAAYAGDVNPELLSTRLSWSEDNPLGQGLTGATVRTGRVQVCQDFRKDPTVQKWAKSLAERNGLAGLICLPLRDGKRTFGLLGLYMAEAREVAGDEIKLLQELADDLAFGIMHVRAAHAKASLEAQLRESQKMEAIGTLAGGIAHDFNNILGAILGNVELARQDAGSNATLLESLDEIRKAGHRAKELIKQILAFSRREPALRSVIELPAIVEESVRLLRTSLPPRVSMDLQVDLATPVVLADPTHIGQVVLNLGTNAAHAMEGRAGLVSVRVGPVKLDEAQAKVHADLVAGDYACITVSDTGCGMDAATLTRIFEPFFTTKPVGVGTGLGLAVVHGIMRSHQGAIAVESEPGKGSSFMLYFPAAQAAAVAAAADPNNPKVVQGGGQHIMYVDDDQALLYLIERLLKRRGYTVSAFANPAEAIEAARKDPNRFDLVITDFNMPGSSGIDVAHEIRRIMPAVPIAVASGYITEELRNEAAQVGVSDLIFKPNAAGEFCDVVQRLLAERADANSKRAL
jgi:PAS domain S-box-containing protein